MGKKKGGLDQRKFSEMFGCLTIMAIFGSLASRAFAFFCLMFSNLCVGLSYWVSYPEIMRLYWLTSLLFLYMSDLFSLLSDCFFGLVLFCFGWVVISWVGENIVEWCRRLA